MLPSNTLDQVVGETLMVAFAMGVNHELRERLTEVPLTQRNDPVQAFSWIERTNRSACALQFGARHGVRITRNTARLEQLPNGGARLPISVADQEARPLKHADARVGELAFDFGA